MHRTPMNENELAEVLSALHDLTLAQSGAIAAQKTIIDALIAAICLSLPPIAEQLSFHIDGLSPHTRSSLDPNSISSYESSIESVKENIKILAGN